MKRFLMIVLVSAIVISSACAAVSLADQQHLIQLTPQARRLIGWIALPAMAAAGALGAIIVFFACIALAIQALWPSIARLFTG